LSTPELRLVHPSVTDARREDAFRYWAFVSYSHRDASAAATLQRALETYRLPRRLVGRATKQGTVPQYIRPIFRDRDELPAGTDLKATVRDALAASRWLIVLCSPSAASSPWVNQEIVEFKEQHGEARVLAVIVDGEPFASRLPGREGEECFPNALRFALTPDGEPQGEPLEPIAVDLRPQGDGKRLALLKLVAGMTGVGVDELARRDAQRRARRMAWVALSATAGMIVMTVLTVMAVQARNEAQNQRAQAEDLIEFMLGDLRKKLEPVGRLDVLDSVGEKALAHYAAQRTDALDANELGRRARALHLIGEIRERRGNLDDALKAFQSAADTTEKLLARAPNDGQRVFDHAQSVYWVGYVSYLRRQTGEAEAAFRRYFDLAQRLMQVDPSNDDWHLETAYATQNLGVVYLNSARSADALQAFTQTREAYLPIVARRPELNFELANSFGWIAKAQEQLGDYSAAIESQRAKTAVLANVPDAARDRQVQRLLANAAYETGLLQLYLGDAKAARASERGALDMFDSLVASDESNLLWLSNSCFARLALAESELTLGDPVAARAELARAGADVQRLTSADASRLTWQVNLRGHVLALQARLAMVDAKPLPIKDLVDYVGNVRLIEAAGKVLDTDQTLIVANADLVLGDLFARDGQAGGALSHWQAVVHRLRGFAQRDNLRVATVLARAHVRLGQFDEARTLAGLLQTSTYRHPAYADLVNELAGGAGPRQAKPFQQR
jgi:tetratricopeptide (TPR) repeat protein